jgi:hypothetical protein
MSFSPFLPLSAHNYGKEYGNHALRDFSSRHGVVHQFTCPYTSAQDGKAERILCTLNDSMRSLLIQASLPYHFWAEALTTATYLINRRPCKPKLLSTPYELLYGHPPDFSHLRVFGCLCFPNLSATSAHKLAPRSMACIFLGYPPNQKGYRCYSLDTRKIIISRHVYFDEDCFPFAQMTATPSTPVPASMPPPPPTDPVHVALARLPAAPAPVPPATPTSGAATPSGSPSPTAPDLIGSTPTASPLSARRTPRPSATPFASAPPAAPPSMPCTPPPAAHAPDLQQHPMVTRARAGISKPNPRYANVADASLFIYNTGDDVALILLYVDDILLKASSAQMIASFFHNRPMLNVAGFVSCSQNWVVIYRQPQLSTVTTSPLCT